MARTGVVILLAAMLAACESNPASTGGDAQTSTGASRGSGQGAAPADPLRAQPMAASGTPERVVAVVNGPACGLFTVAEVSAYRGGDVTPGQYVERGLGCRWAAAGGSGEVVVAVTPAIYHEPDSTARGFRPLENVGRRGFVAANADGWVAGAIAGEDAIRVSVAGGGASESTAIAILTDAVKRRAPDRTKPARPADVF